MTETYVGKLYKENKEFASYLFDDKNNKIIVTSDFCADLFEFTPTNVLSNISKNIKLIFKKQPIISNLLNDVILIHKKLHGASQTNDMIFKQSKELFNKLANKDINKHIKNNGFSWSEELNKLRDFHKEEETNKDKNLSDILDDYNVFFDFENIDDKIEAILLEQKAKRLIQKIYSKSYRHLINETTLNMFKIFVEKNISLSEINNGFGSKLARYNDLEEANEGLSTFVKEMSGWSKNSYIAKAKKAGATIVNTDDNSLALKIHTYEQSKELGSGQWCISYDKKYFKSYKEKNTALFFNYDFSKDPDDRTSMCGLVIHIADLKKLDIVVESAGSVAHGHWRDDRSIYGAFNGRSSLEAFQKKIPKKYTQKDINESMIDAAVAIDDDFKRTEFLLKFNKDRNNISVLTKALKLNLFSVNIDTQCMRSLYDIYDVYNRKRTDKTDSVDLILAKETKAFIGNYFKLSTVISDDWVDTQNESYLLKRMIECNDFDIIKLYVDKVESANLQPLLNVENIDFDNIKNQNEVLDILNIYKKSKSTSPLTSYLLEPLYEISMNNSLDKTDFFEKIFQINGDKISIRDSLEKLNNNLKSKENILTKESNEKRTALIKLALKHIDKRKLNAEFSGFSGNDLNTRYPYIDKEIILKITKMIDNKKSHKMTP